MRIRHALAIRSFMSRCRTSPAAPDVAAAQAATPFRWQLAVAFWTRLFDELKAAGVFANPLASARALEEAMRLFTPVTPANLEVLAGDWALGDG